MINIRINDAMLEEDTEMAKKIIEKKFKPSESNDFHRYSGIFLTTNEKLDDEVFRDIFSKSKRLLSITASGDQILNAILYGVEDITGIDISAFPKYFLALKVAALETLNEEEYIKFIVEDAISSYLNSTEDLLASKYYEKIRENLVEEARSFWDALFGKYSRSQITKSSLFNSTCLPKSETIENNPYLHDGNFEKLKEKLKKVKIELCDGNIFQFNKADFGEFDLILLSNVLDYFRRESNIKGRVSYINFFKSLPLTENGIALAYNLLYNPSFQKCLKRDNFNAYGGCNEILTYQKK